MKYSTLFFILVISGCQEEVSTSFANQDEITGNWLVIEETDKSSNIRHHSASGVITTWNGLSYIGALKIKEDGFVKINSYDGTYSTGIPDGTWTINQRTNIITFNIDTFSKDFKIWKEDRFLYLESATHLLKHEVIE